MEVHLSFDCMLLKILICQHGLQKKLSLCCDHLVSITNYSYLVSFTFSTDKSPPVQHMSSQTSCTDQIFCVASHLKILDVNVLIDLVATL